MNMNEFAAYGGPGWRPRPLSLEAERQVFSEHGPLKEVLLFKPGSELAAIRNPDRVQHLGRIRPAKIEREFDDLCDLYRKLGIRVHFVDRDAFPGPLELFNLMYVRDLFFNTKEGAVVARMGSVVRAGEEKYAALALARLAVPIGRTIGGSGLFEGADALWLNGKTVLCGLGRRTNVAGLQQLEDFLALQGVRCLPIKLPEGVQHLLGILQIVDKDLALIRVKKAPRALMTLLSRQGIRLVEVPESAEVIERQGMNVVTVAPRTIVMPSGCPKLRRLYGSSGIEIAGEAEITELCKGAGGLACATGIVSRGAKL